MSLADETDDGDAECQAMVLLSFDIADFVKRLSQIASQVPFFTITYSHFCCPNGGNLLRWKFSFPLPLPSLTNHFALIAFKLQYFYLNLINLNHQTDIFMQRSIKSSRLTAYLGTISWHYVCLGIATSFYL